MKNCKPCTLCANRQMCVTLCEKAEKYVSQDEIEPDRDMAYTDHIDEYARQIPEGLSTVESILRCYFVDRMETKEIARMHHFSSRHTNRIIKRYKVLLISHIKETIKNPAHF